MTQAHVTRFNVVVCVQSRSFILKLPGFQAICPWYSNGKSCSMHLQLPLVLCSLLAKVSDACLLVQKAGRHQARAHWARPLG